MIQVTPRNKEIKTNISNNEAEKVIPFLHLHPTKLTSNSPTTIGQPKESGVHEWDTKNEQC